MGGIHTTPRPMKLPSRMLEPPGTMRMPSPTPNARSGYVDLSMKRCCVTPVTAPSADSLADRSADMSTIEPMRKPSKIPFFTQPFTRHPVFAAGSGSAARTSPRFSASLNSPNRRKCSSLYCAGGSSNSRSICDGSMHSLGESQRSEHVAHPRQVFRLRRHQWQPPARSEQAHFRHRRLHRDRVRLHEVDLHQRMESPVNLASTGDVPLQ